MILYDFVSQASESDTHEVILFISFGSIYNQMFFRIYRVGLPVNSE